MTLRHAVRSESLKYFGTPNICYLKNHEKYRRLPASGRQRLRSRSAATDSHMAVKPILLFDAMDTLIWDPFYSEMPIFFDMKFQDLLSAKDPKAWPEFEKGNISEEELFDNFFKDRRQVNGPGLLNHMVNGYRYLDGVEELLLDLNRQGLEMHIVSNYPVWYKRVEAKLAVSRFLPWSFVSCEGPMKGLRKPDPESYEVVSKALDVPPERLLLIDDRQTNVVGALEAGWSALQFQNCPALRRDLERRRILEREQWRRPW